MSFMSRRNGQGDFLNMDHVPIHFCQGLTAVGELQYENGNIRDSTNGPSCISHDGTGSRLSNRLRPPPAKTRGRRAEMHCAWLFLQVQRGLQRLVLDDAWRSLPPPCPYSLHFWLWPRVGDAAVFSCHLASAQVKIFFLNAIK